MHGTLNWKCFDVGVKETIMDEQCDQCGRYEPLVDYINLEGEHMRVCKSCAETLSEDE